MKGKNPNYLTLCLTFAAGSLMLVSGTFSIFTAQASTLGNSFASGKLNIHAWTSQDVCGDPFTSSNGDITLPNANQPGYGKLVIENDGTINSWVGLVNTLPNNVTIEYTVDVYQPQSDDVIPADSSKDADENGDIHSNCHTGSKYRGSGGEDNGNDSNWDDPTYIAQPITSYTVNTTESVPSKAFQLPVGDYAIVKYTVNYNGSNAELQDQSSQLKVRVDAVQVRQNDGADGPASWQ